jgi:hypothetical protein
MSKNSISVQLSKRGNAPYPVQLLPKVNLNFLRRNSTYIIAYEMLQSERWIHSHVCDFSQNKQTNKSLAGDEGD